METKDGASEGSGLLIRQLALIIAIISTLPLFVGIRAILTEEYLRSGGIRDPRRPGPDLFGKDAVLIGQKWLAAGGLLSLGSVLMYCMLEARETTTYEQPQARKYSKKSVGQSLDKLQIKLSQAGREVLVKGALCIESKKLSQLIEKGVNRRHGTTGKKVQPIHHKGHSNDPLIERPLKHWQTPGHRGHTFYE